MKSLDELAAIDRYGRAGEFSAVAYAILKAGGVARAADLAQAERLPPRVATIAKAAVEAGTLSSHDLGDFRIAAAGFFDTMREVSAFDALLGSMAKVPLRQPGLRIMSAGMIGSVEAEGLPRPLSGFAVSSAGVDLVVATVFVVVTRELLESSSSIAQAFIARELRGSLAAAGDTWFLAKLAASAGGTVTSSGATLAATLVDLEAALANMTLGAASRLFLIAPSTSAARLRLRLAAQGGSLGDITLVGTAHLAEIAGSPATADALLVDASGLAAAVEDVQLSIARHTSLQMDFGARCRRSADGQHVPEQFDLPARPSIFRCRSRSRRCRAGHWRSSVVTCPC